MFYNIFFDDYTKILFGLKICRGSQDFAEPAGWINFPEQQDYHIAVTWQLNDLFPVPVHGEIPR